MSVLTLYLCSGKPWLWLDIEGPIQQMMLLDQHWHYHMFWTIS